MVLYLLCYCKNNFSNSFNVKKNGVFKLQTSKAFELVLNPFMGSGTTGRVCDKLRRSFVGYDLKRYY